jgi:hypothetical protein
MAPRSGRQLQRYDCVGVTWRDGGAGVKASTTNGKPGATPPKLWSFDDDPLAYQQVQPYFPRRPALIIDRQDLATSPGEFVDDYPCDNDNDNSIEEGKKSLSTRHYEAQPPHRNHNLAPLGICPRTRRPKPSPTPLPTVSTSHRQHVP